MLRSIIDEFSVADSDPFHGSGSKIFEKDPECHKLVSRVRHGSLEHVVNVWTELANMICLRHLFISTAA